MNFIPFLPRRDFDPKAPPSNRLVSIPGYFGRKLRSFQNLSGCDHRILNSLRQGNNSLFETAKKIVQEAERTLARPRTSQLSDAERDRLFKDAVIDLTAYVYAGAYVDREELETQLSKHIYAAFRVNQTADVRLGSRADTKKAITLLREGTAELVKHKAGRYQTYDNKKEILDIAPFELATGKDNTLQLDRSTLEKFFRDFISNSKETPKNRAEAKVLLNVLLGLSHLYTLEFSPEQHEGISPRVYMIASPSIDERSSTPQLEEESSLSSTESPHLKVHFTSETDLTSKNGTQQKGPQAPTMHFLKPR